MEKHQIGKITHYFGKIGVAVIELTDSLKIGDKILIQGHGNEFEQTITSMEIEKKKVDSAKKGESVGMKMEQPVKPGDIVFKI